MTGHTDDPGDEQPEEPDHLAGDEDGAASDDVNDDVDDVDDVDDDVVVDADDVEVDGADADSDADLGVDDLAAFEDDVDDVQLGDVITEELQQVVAQRDEYLDVARRVQADFENYKKRQENQRGLDIERATGSLAEALLPVLDAAEAAYVGHPDEVGPLLNLLLSELKKQGLEAIDLLDQPFDPNLADAVAHEPGDGGDVVVAEVLRSGYTWKGRTLRPAMVRTRD